MQSAKDVTEQVKQLSGYGSWLFTLDIDVYTSSLTTDLDNMPKPIVDTLFRPGVENDNRSHLADITGIVFPDADDARVMQLNMRKTLVEPGEQEGVIIRICWTEAD